ncbi:hypothetical protein EMIT0324P_20293 [Pseudomonas chlororaphis]
MQADARRNGSQMQKQRLRINRIASKLLSRQGRRPPSPAEITPVFSLPC